MAATNRSAKAVLLIAERDRFMQEVLQRALGSEFRLEFVESGSEVASRARANPPALIILEALLPEVDGFQVCRRLKEDAATAKIPVLFFTLLDAEDRARQVGADGFVKKPLRKRELLDRVRELLNESMTSRGGAS